MSRFWRLHKIDFAVVALCCVLAVVLSFAASGCKTIDFGAGRDAVQRTSEGLEEQRQLWEAELVKAAQAGDAERASEVQETLAILSEIQAQNDRMLDAMDRFVDESGQVDPEVAIAEAGLVLPPPWNLIVTIGGPLLVGGVQELRKRQQAKQLLSQSRQLLSQSEEIIAAVDAAKMADPRIADGFKDEGVRSKVWSAMSPETYEFVESRRNT